MPRGRSAHDVGRVSHSSGGAWRGPRVESSDGPESRIHRRALRPRHARRDLGRALAPLSFRHAVRGGKGAWRVRPAARATARRPSSRGSRPASSAPTSRASAVAHARARFRGALPTSSFGEAPCAETAARRRVPSTSFVSFEPVEHIPGQEAFLDEIARVLAPGGVLLLLSCPNKREYSDRRGVKERVPREDCIATS